MAFDAFIKIEGIPGESTDKNHKDWIEVTSYKWGVTQGASHTASTTGGAAHQRADFQDFSFMKNLDKSSPKLALACASGQVAKSVIIELCRAGSDKLKYMEYKLTNAIVSSVATGGGDGGEPQETVMLNYGKIEWTYTQQKREDGSGGGNVAGGWDLQTNSKV